MMRSFLIAAAALAALAFPFEPADADRGSRHWRSAPPGLHWQGHRPWRGHWRAHPGWNRHVWRGHPGWRWRHHPGSVVIVGGGFGRGFGPGFGHVWGPPCRSLWFDGWGWRCAW